MALVCRRGQCTVNRGKEQVRLGTTVDVHPQSKCYADGGISSDECPVLSSAGHTVLRMCVDSMWGKRQVAAAVEKAGAGSSGKL